MTRRSLQKSACVVHDVRLSCDGKQTAHQIDVQISADRQTERRRQCTDRELRM
jgi:hypothetical protein